MTPERRSILAAWARACIDERLGGSQAAMPDGDWLREPAATFVTLEWADGSLQGCIGNLEPHMRLGDAIARNAVAAAFDDPRNRPLDRRSAARLTVDISLLSPLEEMTFRDEAEAMAQLRPGVDGALLEWGRHRGTFLPQVWDSLPRREDFFRELKHKAGLPSDFWAPGVRLWRYTVEKWSDHPKNP